MKNYYFDKDTFIIEDYLNKPTFSNFLPGVAGKKGIPLWVFYVNRGQGISGYGIQDKNGPIMVFDPANQAYSSVGQNGFRTFLKVNGKYYEPFTPGSDNNHRMMINRDSFSIEETNEKLGIKVNVTYFGLPNENIAALIRDVKVTNLNEEKVDIEILDGLAELLPAGVTNQEFKTISNLLSSWMDVDDVEKNIAFYKLRSSTNDDSEVNPVLNGNFIFGTANNKLLKPIVDQEVVFGFDSMKRNALNFMNKTYEELDNQEQVTVNKIPCGFLHYRTTLEAKTSFDFNLISGYAHNKEFLYNFIEKSLSNNYLQRKKQEGKEIIDELVNDVATSTSSNEFNEYIKQNYLDNLLRGGYPYEIGNTIYHLYSRRHGDLERDYNFFSLSPEYYSQGGGNFRDVCQNRRMDSFINKNVSSFNVKHFASLIQLDGFNPLIVNGMRYEIKSDSLRGELVKRHFIDQDNMVYEFLSQKFTPGGLVNYIENHNIEVVTSEKDYLDDIIVNSKELIESVFGEGYWSDHFTYILDLVESYEAIYPDKMHKLLYEDKDLKSFDSTVTVLKKKEKSVINKHGNIRQYGSLLHYDNEKIEKLHMDQNGSNWALIGNKIYKTNLFTKLLILVLNKHSQLDPDGLGVEMETNKPGWNDAMNGVPGLFGSGISETIELKRIAHFLLKHLDSEKIKLPKEIVNFFKELSISTNYTERLSVRENYRDSIRFGLNDSFDELSSDELREYLERLNDMINQNLEVLFKEHNKILPTFLVYDVEEYEPLVNRDGEAVIGNYNLPVINPLKFKGRALPRFLEAPARLLKTDFDQDKLRQMYHAIKESGIYDKELKIYKTSECLDIEDNEIGRIRAFTKGWLERESNFMHMTYKYLLGLLRAGLYEEYYEEIKDNLSCFMNPEVYKRNPLENSSFIAPSNNPNKAIRGQGFFARLSGSTVETINMWAIMMTGGNPFQMKNGELELSLSPKLEKSLFKDDDTVSFTFMKDIKVTLVNPSKEDTYYKEIERYELINETERVVIDGSVISRKYALKIRNKEYKKIIGYIKK